MGKKRKAGSRAFSPDEPRNISEGDSKLRIKTYEDVADSEDEFHINRDKILLEEDPAQKRQRRIREEEEFLELSDEEVLAASEDASDSEDDFEDTQETTALPSERQKSTKSARVADDSDFEASDAPEDGEDAGGWGASRKDYYNADAIETEADALEEETEARRLQQKHLQGMTEADFGFDEVDWLEAGKDGDDEDDRGQGRVVREVLPRLEITDAMGPEERLKILRTRYPEFEPLAKEFLDLQTVFEKLKTTAMEAISIKKKEEASANGALNTEDALTPVSLVKHGALSAYLAALSMYFALLTSGQEDSGGMLTAMPSEELRDHTIMETLVQCRDLWQKVKNIATPEPKLFIAAETPMTKGHSDKALRVNSANKIDIETEDRPKRKKSRRSKAQKAAEAAKIEADASRAERLRKTEEDLANLSARTELHKLPSRSSRSLHPISKGEEDSDSDFGEQTTLTPHEAAEKAQRKKSLRFYTSQIAQKSNKRDAAGRDAGGDADLPYRERLKDRQARLNAEAENRGKKPKENSKRDTLGGPSDEEDHAAAQELRNGEDSGSEDYYDLVASRSADKKAAKAALAAAHAQAEKEGDIVRIVDDEMVGEDGKRAISYQIEKNKGITPKRKKDVRNPRVKKRKKYVDKKKKLSSIRQVYKGGEGKGGYGGELTGIKKGLVKSVKL